MRSDALQGERDFLPEDLEDLIDLRRRIVEDLGEPQSVASGIIGWLVAKKAGDLDLTSSPTRSRYRKILARLDTLPSGPRGSRGMATVTSLATFAAAASAVAPIIHVL